MKTLAWDVDDVLNSLMREWFEDLIRNSQDILITQPWNAGRMGLSETLASLTKAILK